MIADHVHSAYREKLIEHLFIGVCLKRSWRSGDCSLEVSRLEVDASGYDLIMESAGIVRHVQLKASATTAKTSRQNIHTALARKPSGCVVWVRFDAATLDLGPFLFFGGPPGTPLPDIAHLRTARHSKGNADGFKAERHNLRALNKGDFTPLDTLDALWMALFGR